MWLVLDGPVDAIWIENLNSVLDDNKTLTLANGDRIPMAPNTKIVFEPHNIDNASPATVSRNGMVFMSSSALTWKPILEAWTRTLPASQQTAIDSRYDLGWEDTLQFVITSCHPKMDVLDCMYIRQSIDIFKGLLPENNEEFAKVGFQIIARERHSLSELNLSLFQSGQSLKWTVARKWTVLPKVDGLEPNWTVI